MPPSSFEEIEGWIRTKLQAGVPLDPTERAYCESLPPGDPLSLPPVRSRKPAGAR